MNEEDERFQRFLQLSSGTSLTHLAGGLVMVVVGKVAPACVRGLVESRFGSRREVSCNAARIPTRNPRAERFRARSRGFHPMRAHSKEVSCRSEWNKILSCAYNANSLSLYFLGTLTLPAALSFGVKTHIFGPKKHPLSKPYYVPAMTRQSCQKEKVPLFQKNISPKISTKN